MTGSIRRSESTHESTDMTRETAKFRYRGESIGWQTVEYNKLPNCNQLFSSRFTVCEVNFNYESLRSPAIYLSALMTKRKMDDEKCDIDVLIM